MWRDGSSTISLGFMFRKHVSFDVNIYLIWVVRLEPAGASIRSAPDLDLPFQLISQKGREKEQGQAQCGEECRIPELD